MRSKPKYRNPLVEEYLKDPDVHEVKKAGVLGAGMTFIVALFATLLHAANAYLLFWLEYPVLLCLLIHVILVAVAWFLYKLLHGLGRDARFMMLLTITTAGMGVFGAGGTALSIIFHIWHMRISHSFSEWFATIFPKEKLSRPESLYEDIEYGRDQNPLSYSVIPFLDVMSIGSENQKRRALSRMTEYFEPVFAPAFTKAINDNSNAIRVQAATAVTKIENQFTDELMKISGLVKEHPRDPRVRLALAEHYDEYAFTGILDEHRERLNRQRAMEHYQEYLEMKPENVQVRIKLGRLMLRRRMFTEAADWFKECIDKGYSSDAMMIWYLEALYAAERYDELRRQAAGYKGRLEELSKDLPYLADSIALWSGVTPKVGSAS